MARSGLYPKGPRDTQSTVIIIKMITTNHIIILSMTLLLAMSSPFF